MSHTEARERQPLPSPERPTVQNLKRPTRCPLGIPQDDVVETLIPKTQERYWGMTRPAQPDNVLREIAAKLFSKKDLEEIAALEKSFAQTALDINRFCNNETLNREEADVRESDLTGAEKAAKIAEIKKKRDAIPVHLEDIDKRRHNAKLGLRTHAVKLLAPLEERVRLQIVEFIDDRTTNNVLQYWKMDDPATVEQVIKPLQCLYSATLHQIRTASCNRHDELGWVRRLLEQAGVIVQSNPRD